MIRARSTAGMTCLILSLFASSGCLVRRTLTAHSAGNPKGPRPKLITASCAELAEKLQHQYDAINSFNATVDMTPALGSVYKGEITEYQDIVSYILYKSPSDIRIIGLAPVVRSKLFDMVSTGPDFSLYIPSKNRFVEGKNDSPPVSKNSLENLRPEAFLEALLVPPPNPNIETPLCVDSTDLDNSQYVLVLVGRTPEGNLMINRLVYIDRTTLYVSRQKTFDAKGDILSDTQYKDWAIYNGISFPKTIAINRPKDGYGVSISVTKMAINENVTDDKFVLARPEGTQLQIIGDAKPATPARPTQ
jgi:outer membrane lipoprotein-sorting protein